MKRGVEKKYLVFGGLFLAALLLILVFSPAMTGNVTMTGNGILDNIESQADYDRQIKVPRDVPLRLAMLHWLQSYRLLAFL